MKVEIDVPILSIKEEAWYRPEPIILAPETDGICIPELVTDRSEHLILASSIF